MTNSHPGAPRPHFSWFSIIALLLLGNLLAIGRATADAAPFQVADISERAFDDAPALAVTLSRPLAANKRYDSYIYVSTQGKTVSGGWVLSSNRRVLYFSNIQPEKTYRVAVRSGLPAEDKSVLTQAREKTVTTRAAPPVYDFASRGSILPPRLNGGLPVVTVNVPDIDIEFLRVKNTSIREFLTQMSGNRYEWRWNVRSMSHMWESVHLARYVTKGRPNARAISYIPVENIKELQHPGLYLAVMRKPGTLDESGTRFTYFSVSDIGIHVRSYRGETLVITNSLVKSWALPKTGVELFDSSGHSIAKSMSDTKGIAHFAQAARPGMLVVARNGANTSYLLLRESALDLSEFDVSGRAQQALEVYAYGDRDLYRPGETAQVSALLRDYDGRAVESQPLQAILRRPDGQSLPPTTWSSKATGYYHSAVKIPSDAQTGKWTLELRADPAASKPSGTYAFSVEEFLPERMKLELLNDRTHLSPKDDFTVKVEGDYLYGAPAAGNRFTAVANIVRAEQPVTGLPGFVFGDATDQIEARREELPELTLDDQGRAELHFQPFSERPSSPMQVRITGQLFETGGRPVVRSIERVVWPAQALVGVRPLFANKVAPSNSTVSFEAVRVSSDAKLLAGKQLEVKVIHEDRHYYWSHNNERGWFREYSQAEYPVYTQSLDIPAGGRGQFAFPVEWGRYRVEIFDPATRLTTRYRVFAGWVDDDRNEESARPDRVAIKLDKPVYRAGDTIKVTLTPPHTGEALVTLESDELLWSTRITVQKGGAVLAIPVSPDWNYHNLYVSAVVFRPALGKDRITPTRAVGVAHVALDRTDRQLPVKIDAPKQIRPESTMKVKVALPNAAGESAFVTVAAVDLGILNITRYKTPNPHSYFFAKREYGVESHDLYAKIIENIKGERARMRFGGDRDMAGAGSGKRPPSKVKTVALFSGVIQVNANGEADIELPVPDFNGTLRIMAIGFSANRYGAGESEVVVAAPVVAEAAMPRFLAPGDRSRLALDVQNLSGHEKNLALELTATAPLTLGKGEQTITLKDKQKRTLYFELGAKEDFGEGIIKLNIKGNDVNIKRQFSLGVRPAFPAERRTASRILRKGESIKLDAADLSGLMEQTVEGHVLASTTPPLDIRSAVEGLLHYPYGCLEQTTSSAYPHLFVDETAAKTLGLKPLSWAERVERIDSAIQRLSTMQLSSGGFGLWNDASPEEPYLTPYVANFLLDAQKQGFAVPKTMLERVLNNLEQRLLGNDNTWAERGYWDSGHLEFAAQTYAGYVLARVGRAPLGALRTLYDSERSKAKSGLPLVHLGLALRMQGDIPRGEQAIEQAFELKRDNYFYWGDYGSPGRDIALMYALLARHDVADKKREALLLSLRDTLKNRPYLSTQERFAIFLAAQAMGLTTGQPWRGMLKIAKNAEQVGERPTLRRRISPEQIKMGVELRSDNDANIYVETEVQGYPRLAPAAQSKDIKIERKLFTMSGTPAGNRALRVGELLVVNLHIQSKEDIEDGLVVDLAPAGLEVENLNLTQGETLRSLKINGINLADAMQSEAIRHQEFRDDRYVAALRLSEGETANLFYLVRVVSPGEFVVPPPYVEDMYRPHIRAVGVTSATLRVENGAK
ncbi:MAG: alpha-2-macroglobulin family protein [Gammaproteobacteria bacterium]|nr:alpha-2-macroglobulin family protein [Gammaproteobacteria bacterium]